MIRTINRVVLYARFSSDNQRTESIDAQIRAMNDYCKKNGYMIVNTYIDEAKTATTDKRESFQQMIADSKDKFFDIVLVHKLDRFARNRYDSAVYKRELKKNGVVVKSVIENLDDSPESIMMESVLEGMNEYYSRNLGREVMKGMKETALQCKHTGGKPPLGYDIDEETKKLIINEYEAETVRIIFEMYSQGYGYTAILKNLNQEGRKTKNGNDFAKNSLYSILTNPKYQGTYVYNRSSAKSITGTRNTHLLKDYEEIITVKEGCPRIVNDEIYNEVQKRITENKQKGGRLNAKESYLLTGKVYCKECGRAMVGNKRYSGRNKLLYVTYRCPSQRYICSNREINKTYLESYVTDMLEREVFNRKSLKRMSEQIKAQSKTDNVNTRNDIAKLELKEINEALQNVADAVASGLISDALINKLKELEEKKRQAELRIISAEAIATDVNVDVDLILSEYNEVSKSPNLPCYRAYITNFIDRIEVGKYTVNISLKTGLDIFDELNTTYTVRRQEIYEYKQKEAV